MDANSIAIVAVSQGWVNDAGSLVFQHFKLDTFVSVKVQSFFKLGSIYCVLICIIWRRREKNTRPAVYLEKEVYTKKNKAYRKN